MAVQGITGIKNSGMDFDDTLLPDGLYDITIEKVVAKEGTKYMSTEPQMQLLFYCRPITDGEEYKDKLLFYSTSLVFTPARTVNGAKRSPSKLYTLIETINKSYSPDRDISSLEISDDTINELEGKKFKALVKTNQNGKNKIESILPIEKEKIKTEKKQIDDEISSDDMPL